MAIKTYFKQSLLFTALLGFTFTSFSQKTDSTIVSTKFSGSITLTNNGFAIIPTFSLNSPAAIFNLSWRTKQFSIEPDIRLVPDGTKGGLLLWLRYRLVENPKFSLRVGGHPAFSFIRKTISDNGVNREITEMLRFAAFEVVPNFQITPHWSIGAMYLEGHGLQNHGPQTTRVLFLNTNISNIKLGGDFRFTFIPVVYFLNTDNSTGNYFTATGILSNTKLPFSLQSTINQTLNSNIAGNQDFMWNVGLTYTFSKDFKRVK
jgi:hypothetical protein